MSWGWGWRPYVSVADRRAKAVRHVGNLRKQGLHVQPVQLEGRKIAQTFWGESWCKHLESFSDYENRLPRGRTYVRNGSVCHLEVGKGEIKAIVSGSEIYNVKIKIERLSPGKWNSIKTRCAGQVGSLIELLKGKLSSGVMAVVTDRSQGLFPLPAEIKLECSCPDWAVMCKHVAAVLYGVGARLDQEPELLFLLRAVDHLELIASNTEAAASLTGGSKQGKRRIAASDLGDVFGIEMLAGDSAQKRSHEKTSAKDTSKVGVKAPKPAEEARISAVGSRKPLASSKAQSRPAINRLEKGANPACSKVQAGSKSRSIVKPESGVKSGLKAQSGAKSGPKAQSGLQIAQKKQASTESPTLTGKFVRDLRTRLGMSVEELASLIGASAASVRKWEQERGQLNCQTRTRNALHEAAGLSKKRAWSRL